MDEISLSELKKLLKLCGAIETISEEENFVMQTALYSDYTFTIRVLSSFTDNIIFEGEDLDRHTLQDAQDVIKHYFKLMVIPGVTGENE